MVRELSIKLMGMSISKGEDIPFAYLFYFFNIFIPLAYLYYGIRKKSILFIRLGLLVSTLSIITFKYYFIPGSTMLFITISGAFLIIIALILFNLHKKTRHGFTQKKLLQERWASQDFAAIIASQTLGQSRIDNTSTGNSFKGGNFGGGGAGSSW